MSMDRKPTLDDIQENLVEIVTIGHETLDDDHDKLIHNVNQLQVFFNKPASFVYDKNNSSQFYEPVNVITSAMATVEPLVGHEKKDMFRVESGMNIVDDISQPVPDSSESAKSSGSMLSSLFGRPKKKKPENPPYQHYLPYANRKLGKIDRMEAVVELYQYGVELADSILGLDSIGLEHILAIQRTYFPKDVANSVIRFHRQYIEQRKEKEKSHALSIAVANQSEMKQIQKQKELSGMGTQ